MVNLHVWSQGLYPPSLVKIRLLTKKTKEDLYSDSRMGVPFEFEGIFGNVLGRLLRINRENLNFFIFSCIFVQLFWHLLLYEKSIFHTHFQEKYVKKTQLFLNTALKNKKILPLTVDSNRALKTELETCMALDFWSRESRKTQGFPYLV